MIANWHTWILLIAAIWRLAHMTAWEDGVFGVNVKIRKKYFKIKTGYKVHGQFTRYDKVPQSKGDLIRYECELPPSMQDTLWQKGIKCVYCISFWYSLIAWGSYLLFPTAVMIVATPLALNVAVILANRVLTE